MSQDLSPTPRPNRKLRSIPRTDNPEFEAVRDRMEEMLSKPTSSLLAAEDLLPDNRIREEPVVEQKPPEEQIRERITATIDTLTNTVVSNIHRLRIQLDGLEQAMQENCKATKEALEHHIQVGAATLRAAQQIEAQIQSFRTIVHETTPSSPPQREDQVGGSDPNVAREPI